jgi:hypothetical protein
LSTVVARPLSGLRGLVENVAHFGRKIASAIRLAQEVLDRVSALMLALDSAVRIS